MSSAAPPLSEVSKSISSRIRPTNAAESLEAHAESVPNTPHIALALQIQHNLQYQHGWTALKLHTHSSNPPYSELTRPLLSGLPPSRLYVHPNQQAAEIAEQKAKEAQETIPTSEVGPITEPLDGLRPDPAGAGNEQYIVEQEWVMPTHLREKWSLKQFAEAFDALGTVTGSSSDPTQASHEPDRDGSAGAGPPTTEPSEKQSRRQTKRLLLAILSDDSTVNYYILHDGIVKPRQN